MTDKNETSEAAATAFEAKDEISNTHKYSRNFPFVQPVSSALTFLQMVHPARDARICLMLLYHGPELPEDAAFVLLPKLDEKTGKIEDTPVFLRKDRGVPAVQVWLERWDVQKWRGALWKANQCGWDIYYSVSSYGNEKTPKKHEYSRKRSNVASLSCLFVDFDEENEASRCLSAGQPYMDIPPANLKVCTSAGHFQFIWLLCQPLTGVDLERLAVPALAHVCEACQSDKAVKDLPRVLRLPDYVNNKRGFSVTASRSFAPRLGRADVEWLANVGSPKRQKKICGDSDFLQNFGDNVPSSPSPVTPFSIQPKKTDAKDYFAEATRRWNVAANHCCGDYAAACYLAVCRFSEREIVDFLCAVHPWKKRSAHELTARNASAEIARQRAAGLL